MTAMTAMSSFAQAQTYPTRAVRIVVGYPPGAGNDVIGRVVMAEVSKAIGQQFVYDNRPGASGNIAAEMVARSAPDGYTLLNVPGSIAMASSVQAKPAYDLLRDFDVIAVMASVPFVLIVHPSLPVKSVRELVEFAKARPGQLTFGSAGVGGGPHLTAELFAQRAGIKLMHIAYRGTVQAGADVASGEISMLFSPSSSVMPLVQSKRVRALAVTGSERMTVLPDVPTVKESAYADFEARNWIGLLAPRGMAEENISRLNAEINRAVQTAVVRERFANLGAQPLQGSPKQWAAYLRDEVAKWARVSKAAGVRLE